MWYAQTAIMRFQDLHGRIPNLDDLEDLAFDEDHMPTYTGFPLHSRPGELQS